jgi:hypothetical protein
MTTIRTSPVRTRPRQVGSSARGSRPFFIVVATPCPVSLVAHVGLLFPGLQEADNRA